MKQQSTRRKGLILFILCNLCSKTSTSIISSQTMKRILQTLQTRKINNKHKKNINHTKINNNQKIYNPNIPNDTNNHFLPTENLTNSIVIICIARFENRRRGIMATFAYSGAVK